jgi:hypothetical protein
MSQIINKLRKHQLPFSVKNNLITKGMLIVLLSTIASPISAQSSITLKIAQTQDAAQIDLVAKQLLGRWEAKDPTSNKVFTFIFAPDGKLFLVLPKRDGSSVALKIGYQINTTTKPMQLDIQLGPDQKALTIFEFTADGKLRLDLDGLTPGQPRTSKFQPNAVLFNKISEVTTVPENIQVIELKDSNNRVSQKPEDEAKKYMYALTQVQQAYYKEQGKFATKFEEVSIGLRTETESYRYKIISQGDNTESVMMTAESKNTTLPSYTSVVFATKVNGEIKTVVKICETNQPSTKAPGMLTIIPGEVSLEIKCPVGSRPLR